MKYDVSQYFIAYFDILGYKSFFEDKESDVNEFLESIIEISNDVVRTTSQKKALGEKNMIRSFSDNFLIMLDAGGTDEYHAIRLLSYLLALLQLRFLEKYRILIRGSITKGDAYINESIVFGEGLIKSVALEETAIFPRIILDETRISKDVCEELCEQCIALDIDEKYFVNFFDALNKKNGTDYYADDAERNLLMIKKNITKMIKRHGKFNRNLKDIQKIGQAERNISKYLWLVTKYNEFCSFKYEEYAIEYGFVLYHRLMKSEIHCK